MQLESGVAVAVAGSYSSDSTPSLGTSICPGCGPQKTKKKKKKKKQNVSITGQGALKLLQRIPHLEDLGLSRLVPS